MAEYKNAKQMQNRCKTDAKQIQKDKKCTENMQYKQKIQRI